MSNYRNGFPIGYPTNNLFNPQQTQYTQNTQAQQDSQPQNLNMIWVEGWEAAKAYMLAPNTTIPLWDSNAEKIYIKSADKYGKPSYQVLSYTRDELPDDTIAPDQYMTKEQFKSYMDEYMENFKKEILNVQSSVSHVKQNKYRPKREYLQSRETEPAEPV